MKINRRVEATLLLGQPLQFSEYYYIKQLMMKKINFLWLLSVWMLMQGYLTSCSSDEPSLSPLIGTWQTISNVGWEKEDGELIDEWVYLPGDGIFEEQRFVFKENGICHGYDKKDEQWVEEGISKWKHEGDKLHVYDTTGVFEGTMTIKSVSDTQLVLEKHVKEVDEEFTFEFLSTITCQRIPD